MIIGYTAGVYDLFHMWHLNLLKNAKSMCDKLVVGITVDELVKYKGKEAFIPFTERAEIVRSCKYVDLVVPQENMDKITMCKKLGATYLFVGDDWYGTEKWKDYEKEAIKDGIKVIYFPYTKSVSSTKIREALKNERWWTLTDDGKTIEEKEDKQIIDKDFCCSSFLSFRFIEKDNIDFFDGLHHRTYKLHRREELKGIGDEIELDNELKEIFKSVEDKKLGILLSGGMDSACLASYMPKGSDAYTFRFLNGKYDPEELHRAEIFAKECKLNLHYVDINFDIIKECLKPVMDSKNAPVHSIEPQLYKASLQAKEDWVNMLVIGDAADYVFYGMDGLLSKDWTLDEFYKRSIYIEPSEVLKYPKDIKYLFERYRMDNGMIDFLRFYDKVITEESYWSYENAFHAANINYIDPYEKMKLRDPVDLNRIRNGDSKYYIRLLFKMKYPNIPLPEKHPMPRPVDEYFKNWKGPTRKEFRDDIDIKKYSGNQKWLLWCLEQFLDDYDK